jgi:cell division septation protein DedD
MTSRWVVQLGAFSQQANASALAERLRRRGYAAFVQEMGMGSGRLFRVRIGPQAGRQEAESLRNQIRRELQMDGQVRPY